MSLDARVLSRNPKIEEAPLESELMLFDPASAGFFVLNPTMAYIWRHCDGARPVGRIVEGLVADFEGATPSAAETDVREAVEELVSRGLLVDAGKPRV